MASDLYPTSTRSLPAAGNPTVADAEWGTLAGRFAPDGLLAVPGSSAAAVTYSAGSFTVQPYQMLINGRVMTEPTAFTIPVVVNASTTKRYDVIVARVVGGKVQTTSVRQGSAGAGLPTLSRDSAGTYEVPIAQVESSSAGYAVTRGLRTWVSPQGDLIAESNYSIDCVDSSPTFPSGCTYYDRTNGRLMIKQGTGWRTIYEDLAASITGSTSWGSSGTGTGYTAFVQRKNGWVYLSGGFIRQGSTWPGSDTDSYVCQLPDPIFYPANDVFGVCKCGGAWTQYTLAADVGSLRLQYHNGADVGVGATVRLSASWPAKG